MEIFQDDQEPQYYDKDLLNNWIDRDIDNSQIPHKMIVAHYILILFQNDIFVLITEQYLNI